MRFSKFHIIFALLAFTPTSHACSDHSSEGGEHGHALHSLLEPSQPIRPPTKDLVWGDINIIHTTDTHGWLLGHQKKQYPEPNYSGDFGDFYSFVTHMKKIAADKKVDLLLVDSGDLHDGTGLSDGYPVGGVDGTETNKVIEQLPYDILTIGNHELYNYTVALDMHNNFAPKFEDKYLTSNANISVDGAPPVPVGWRVRNFTTTNPDPNKRRNVTALGVLFNMRPQDPRLVVTPVEKMVTEKWFTDAINGKPDIFLLAGHMPITEGDKDYHWPVVINAIRKVHKYIPILILGGHSHIRACNQFDNYTMSLQSGKYMDTVGWMSVNLTGGEENPAFSRRYLDANRVTYEYHTHLEDNDFDTDHGKKITGELEDLWNKYNLSEKYGSVPQDYYLDRVPYGWKDHSLLTELATKVLPRTITNSSRTNPNIILTNTGWLRFDIYGGDFNKNDVLTLVDVTDGFDYVADVPLSVARQVFPMLKNATKMSTCPRLSERGYVEDMYGAWRKQMNQVVLEGEGNRKREELEPLTPGFVTPPGYDSCSNTDDPSDTGDDTAHVALYYYPPPPYISSPVPTNLPDNTKIDLVFLDYIGPKVICALNFVGPKKDYKLKDIIKSYTKETSKSIWPLYAEQCWNGTLCT